MCVGVDGWGGLCAPRPRLGTAGTGPGTRPASADSASSAFASGSRSQRSPVGHKCKSAAGVHTSTGECTDRTCLTRSGVKRGEAERLQSHVGQYGGNTRAEAGAQTASVGHSAGTRSCIDGRDQARGFPRLWGLVGSAVSHHNAGDREPTAADEEEYPAECTACRRASEVSGNTPRGRSVQTRGCASKNRPVETS